jgi:hypothetical protein
MTYALLSEVWGDVKPKKSKKKKKRVSFQDEGPNGPIVPMTPQEMETELLEDVPIPQQAHVAEGRVRAKPYSPAGPEYQHLSQESYRMPNEHMLPYAKPMRRMGFPMNRMVNHEEDPEWLEFLEFRKAKQSPPDTSTASSSLSLSSLTGQGEQFNELLLYMFTGFFLLMLYDNVYKLGRDSY